MVALTSRLPVLVATALLLSGCASAASTMSDDPYAITSTNRPPIVKLLVRNMNFSDVRIFALQPEGRVPVGQVTGKQDAEFQLDWPMSAYMSIEIDMVAGPRCVTDEMQVDPGDILELQIAVVFNQTTGCR